MPKKKSVRKSAIEFRQRVDDILTFLNTVSVGQSKEHVSWLYNYGIIRLYREFERLMLDTLVGAINNDTRMLSSVTRISFPKHLTEELCEFLIIGTGYFDFKGRDGLIKLLKQSVPNEHYLVTIIKKDKYKDSLERLSSLRNFAAHESRPSKNSALDSVNQKRLASSGSWLKCQGRFEAITDRLKELADEFNAAAPY